MSTADPHARLEQSYRRLLWLFPPSYRRSRGRELLDVLMERADPGQRRPSPAESVALLRFSVRTWASRALSPAPAAARNAMGLLAVVLPMLLLFPRPPPCMSTHRSADSGWTSCRSERTSRRGCCGV
ncbi:hypothetical protein ABIB25_005200 [Nakamurella sp. UYEF19]|uniref:hypothetical protein n=1 Tax=Nakamurella sp. UYEF19 TaxID=1756392 RepID=UPI003396DB67